jgi:A1 cistron-splicing factor AAR2
VKLISNGFSRFEFSSIFLFTERFSPNKINKRSLAQQKMDQYAYLIVTGAPDSTEFGIDLLAISITVEFRGVKLIPPGPHFVYSSSRDSFGNASTARNGFIHYFKAGEIVVKEWNQQLEELQNRTKGDLELEKERIKQHLKDLDR